MGNLAAAFLRGLGLTPFEFLTIVGAVALIGLLVVLGVLLLEADDPRWRRVRCSRCAETSSGQAAACRHCGQPFGRPA